MLWPYVIDVILGASVCCVFNWSCCQTSGPSSSYSWRSSTMNACSPTSQSCRRTGVWHLISPKKHTQHILVAKWNCVWFACCALMCSQRAKRGRRTAAAACLLRQTAWARNTLRRWARCAELTSGKPQRDALLRVACLWCGSAHTQTSRAARCLKWMLSFPPFAVIAATQKAFSTSFALTICCYLCLSDEDKSRSWDWATVSTMREDRGRNENQFE